MNSKHLVVLLILIIMTSCSKDGEEISLQSELSEYDVDVIEYFQEIALGFEFGEQSKITRKWNSEMRIFIGGEWNSELLNELESIRNEINELATDGFRMTIVDDSLQSNYYIFLGTGLDYAQLFPSQTSLVDSNWGLFSLFYNGQNQLTSGYMYVDIERASLTIQRHLLREELTQSLGLAQDSPRYEDSIFQSSWTNTTEYAMIDEDLIRLLYHPSMSTGLDDEQVEKVLISILSPENA